MSEIMTLCIIQENSKILLGMKKRGFGKGRWNGFGGKVHNGETIEQAMKRELKEEAGITASKFQKIAIANFYFKRTDEHLPVHIFKITNFKGKPVETGEMKPEWFDIKNIPFKKMWPDDKFWMPYFLRNRKFKAHFEFENYNKIIAYRIKETGK